MNDFLYREETGESGTAGTIVLVIIQYIQTWNRFRLICKT